MAKPFYPEGAYTCRITKQRFAISPKKGTMAFVLEFVVLKRVDDPDAELLSQSRTIDFWLTTKTVVRVRADLRILGFNGASLSELDPGLPDYFSLTGWEVTMHCRHGENAEGNAREEWTPRGSNLQPLADKRPLAELDAILAKVDREEERMNRRITKPPSGNDGLGITDDDVPF
jgi:hypothetical protein